MGMEQLSSEVDRMETVARNWVQRAPGSRVAFEEELNKIEQLPENSRKAIQALYDKDKLHDSSLPALDFVSPQHHSSGCHGENGGRKNICW
jgi:hypothetical protein